MCDRRHSLDKVGDQPAQVLRRAHYRTHRRSFLSRRTSGAGALAVALVTRMTVDRLIWALRLSMTTCRISCHASSRTIVLSARGLLAACRSAALPDTSLEAGETLPGSGGRAGQRRGWRRRRVSDSARHQVRLRHPLRQPGGCDAARGRGARRLGGPPAFVRGGGPAAAVRTAAIGTVDVRAAVACAVAGPLVPARAADRMPPSAEPV